MMSHYMSPRRCHSLCLEFQRPLLRYGCDDMTACVGLAYDVVCLDRHRSVVVLLVWIDVSVYC